MVTEEDRLSGPRAQRVAPPDDLPQNPQMQSITEMERSAIRLRAIELVERALQLCDGTESWGPACHLQLGLDMLVALQGGDDAVSSVVNSDSHAIDFADRWTHDVIRPD